MKQADAELRTRLYALKGMLTELPEGDRDKAERCINELKSVLSAYDVHVALSAVSIVAVEFTLNTK